MGTVETRSARRARTCPEARRRRSSPLAPRALGVAAALLVAAVVALLGAVPASAHAQFTGSDPTEGAQLEQLPADAVMSYSEDITPQFVETAVVTPDGTLVPTTATVQGRDVSVDLSAADVLAHAGQSGSWQVVARVVSVDGHPVEHTTTFALAESESESESAPESAPEATSGPTSGTSAGAGTGVLGAAVAASPAATDPAAEPTTDSSPGPIEPAAALTDGLPSWAVVLAAAAVVAAAGAALLVQLRRRPLQD